MTDSFKNNEGAQRFEYHVQNNYAFADYTLEGGTLKIHHVEAPIALRGTGAAGVLMQNIVDWALAEKVEITPICGYAAAWLRKHQK